MTATYDRGRGLTLERTLNAPRELVFQSWTDPASLDWYASGLPGDIEPTTVDLRVGGYWRQTMIVGSDELYTSGGLYREITPPSKLVYLWGSTDGWPKLDPDNLDDALQVTITFDELAESQTRMTFVLSVPDHFTDEKATELTGGFMPEGWGMTIDRLVTKFAGASSEV